MPRATTTFHNGIRTYTLERPGTETGTLTFGVGMRDEPPTMAGVTHLVEHVILRLTHPVPDVHGGTVKEDSVEFFATGTADAVAYFLTTVASVISNLQRVTAEDLQLEKDIIEAEWSNAFRFISPGLLANRFGARGLGAAALGAPTTEALSRTEVIAWAQHWLTVENAALSFTGEVPAALDVRLPSGPAVVHAPVPSARETPRLVTSGKAGVAFSLIVPIELQAFVGAALNDELLTRLRHAEGLIYSVNHFTTRIDDESSQLDLVLDPLDRNLVAALRAGVRAIKDVAESGFSAEATNSARSIVASSVGADPAGGSLYLDDLAIDGLLLRRTVTPAETLTIGETLTAGMLTQALQKSIPTLLVAVHEDAHLPAKLRRELNLPVDRQRIWTRHKDRESVQRHRALRAGHEPWRAKASKDRLWVTDTHVLRREGNRLASIEHADIVLVGHRECGCVVLLDRWGRSTEYDPTEWKRGKKLSRQLVAAFSPEIVRGFPPHE
ncbi:insulinase family protein [Mycetocola zhujimingii]|uniref:insulinase family protein n=1 Tax=Mycetocola zhujimingii TaxID=2079792 RepID=UPI000D3B81C6|nr:insulinase family protein [Mycetocola zhujimingii]AWB86919.1 hypothetical protein C3E77_10025 [Mycetocola zhujimingii]